MERREITDSLLVAFLSLRGFAVHPRSIGKVVSFVVTGDGLTKGIEESYSNPSIPVLEFCKVYRSLRSAIFNLKGTRP